MKRLMKAALLIVIGSLIGKLFGNIVTMDNPDPDTIYVMSVLFAGVPFGWLFIHKYIGTFTITGSLPLFVGLLAVKITVCIMIGWILMAVEIIRGIYELIIELKNSDVKGFSFQIPGKRTDTQNTFCS